MPKKLYEILLDENEQKVLNQMVTDTDMTPAGVLRQALRIYQMYREGHLILDPSKKIDTYGCMGDDN